MNILIDVDGATLTRPTILLDFDSPQIRTLIAERGWNAHDRYGRIGAAYDFVRDEIAFGHNEADDLLASGASRTASVNATPKPRC